MFGSQAGFFQNGLGERGQRASNNRCGVTHWLTTEANGRLSVWHRATSQCLYENINSRGDGVTGICYYHWTGLDHCLDQVGNNTQHSLTDMFSLVDLTHYLQGELGEV